MLSRPLDQGIDRIKTLVIKMAKVTEESLDLSTRGFMKKEDTGVQVKAWSNTILILSEEVEDRATELMALHQPMAGDLRTLKAYIKIAYYIERYSRYSMDISDIINRLEDWTEPPCVLRIEEMIQKTKECVALSVKLIQEMDEKLIFELSRRETETDELYLWNLKTLSECKKADPKSIMAYTLTIRYLERIADHSSYIAESLTYASTGKRMSLR
jgi:phosphate transport system protein